MYGAADSAAAVEAEGYMAVVEVVEALAAAEVAWPHGRSGAEWRPDQPEAAADIIPAHR
jgi:hypothetical protein